MKRTRRLTEASYMIQILGDMSEIMVKKCNAIIHHAFYPGEDDTRPYLENMPRDTVCSLVVYGETENHDIAGIALAEPKSISVDEEFLSNTQINIHSIAIDPHYQGRGLCRKLVSTLVADIKERYKHLVRDGVYPVYLHVRVTKDNANHGAIKCYRHNNFVFVNIPPVEKDDGPNAFMRLAETGTRRKEKTRRRVRKKTNSKKKKPKRNK